MQSKRALLTWINTTLSADIKSIEELGKGHVYAQLLSKIDNTFPVKNINKNPLNEVEYLKNLKLCQQFFTKEKITVCFPIDRICKCKVQDNLEFLQWLYKFVNNYEEDNKNKEKTHFEKLENLSINENSSISKTSNQNRNSKNNTSLNKTNSKISDSSASSIFKTNKQSCVLNKSNSQHDILDMYSSHKTECKECVDKTKIIKEFKDYKYYLDSKTKYYEAKTIEMDKKMKELDAREIKKETKEKETQLMKGEVDFVTERDNIKEIKDKVAFLQDALIMQKEEDEKNKKEIRALKKQVENYKAQIDNFEDIEMKNKEEFMNEIEKLKIYYENLLGDKQKMINENKEYYVNYIKGYERERDLYYTKLKKVETFLKKYDGDDGLKNQLFQLLHKKE